MKNRAILLLVFNFYISINCFSQYQHFLQYITPYLSSPVVSGFYHINPSNSFQPGYLYQQYRVNTPDFDNQMILIDYHVDSLVGYSHYKYQQLYKNIPVEGAGCIEHFNESNKLKYINAKLVDSIKQDTKPRFGPDEAINLLLEKLNSSGRTSFAWDSPEYEAQIQQDMNDSTATWYPDGKNAHTDHPDINNLQPGYKLYTNPIELFSINTIANSANGHGMAVVGVIGATPNNNNLGAREAVGMAYGSEIHPYLLGSINSADIIKGLQQAVLDDIDILNMSFRSVYDQSVALQLDNCFDIGRPSNSVPNSYLGMILVSGSGNTDVQESNFPANQTAVIGVGMSNPNDYRSSYNAPGFAWTINFQNGSTYGPPSFGYDVVAPGELMYTLDLQGGNGSDFGDYQLSSGTSVSAPVVSSIAAILLQKNSQLTSIEVRDLLRNGAEKKYPNIYNYNMYPNEPGYNNEMFYGRVSCINSLDLTTLGYTNITPNPKLIIAHAENDNFTIYVPIQIEDYQIEIINGQGQKIKTFKNKLDSSGENSITVDLGSLSSGVYFVNLIMKNGLALSGKILK